MSRFVDKAELSTLINPCQCGYPTVSIFNADAMGANGEDREIYLKCHACGCSTLPFLYKQDDSVGIRKITRSAAVRSWNRINPIKVD